MALTATDGYAICGAAAEPAAAGVTTPSGTINERARPSGTGGFMGGSLDALRRRASGAQSSM